MNRYNTREHFAVHGFKSKPFEVNSRWHSGRCDITTYDLDELLGTKMRAFFQRRKGRDLFDLALALESGDADAERVINAFQAYMDHGEHKATRALFQKNLAEKLSDPLYGKDVPPLLPVGTLWGERELANAAELFSGKLIKLLPGEPWKGSGMG